MSLKLTPAEHACPVLNKHSLDSVSSKDLHSDIIAHTPRSDPHFRRRSRLNQITSLQLSVTDMRLRSKLFYVFLAVVLIVASIVEASKKRNRDGNGKKNKKQKLISSTISIGALRTNGGAPIQGNSGPRLGSKRTSGENASVGESPSTVEGGKYEVVSSVASESSTEINDALGKDFRKALDGRNFEWLKENWVRWEGRKDLLDDVIRRGTDFTVRFIQDAMITTNRVLAALFDKGEGVIDEVLERIEYWDHNLYNLTDHRHELAISREKFFRILGKIKEPENQELAVRGGVINLFDAEKHDLVVPLVNALGKRTFKSDRLGEEAIHAAFHEGSRRCNQDIVELYHEHPAITSEEYAIGLLASWNKGEPNQVFQFLVEQADQGDLDEAKGNMR